MNPQGTPFQRRVWQALEAIPWGEIRSYRDIAQAVDSPRGFRAVGMANHHNPIPIFIPCHRVVFRDGSLAPGFAFGGAGAQRALLEAEGVPFLPDGRVDLSRCRWENEKESL